MSVSKPKAYSYIRFSTPEQARGDSYRRQLEEAERFCAEQGIQLVDSKEYLFFDKGKSAYSGKHVDANSELARFLKYVDEGMISPGSYLIVESLDRLSRERVIEAMTRFLALLSKGVRIYTSADKMLYSDDSQSHQLLVSIMSMHRAHEESSLKGKRVSAAWKKKQQDARDNLTPLGRACPYWLSYDGSQYIPEKDRIEVIQKIFELSIEGRGQRSIAKSLNLSGVPVFGSEKRNHKGLWSSSSVCKILTNRALLGEYQPTNLVGGKRVNSGEPIKDFFPRIISEEIYYQAQNMRSVRRAFKSTKNSLNFNIWQGVAKCGFCRSAMHLDNKGRDQKYLKCYGAAKGACSAKPVKLERAESAYKEILAKLDSVSLVQGAQSKIKKEIEIIDGKYSLLAARKAELMSQAGRLDSAIPEAFVQILADIQDQMDECSAARERLKEEVQREKVIDKRDFFERLDLISYEGRSRSNHLLKFLNVRVAIKRQEDAILYYVYIGDERTFGLVDNDQMIKFYPYTRDALESIRAQGDESHVTEHGEVVIREKEAAIVSDAGMQVNSGYVRVNVSSGLVKLVPESD